MEPFDHGALTDLTLDLLAAGLGTGPTDPPVGDGVAPVEGGWVNGQPGDGVFRPYVVLVSGGAAPRYQDLSSFDPHWAVSFSLRSFGGSRRQCDWMATEVRKLVHALAGSVFGTWSIIGIEWAGLGPVARNDATAPPYWQVIDNVNLVVSA